MKSRNLEEEDDDDEEEEEEEEDDDDELGEEIKPLQRPSPSSSPNLERITKLKKAYLHSKPDETDSETIDYGTEQPLIDKLRKHNTESRETLGMLLASGFVSTRIGMKQPADHMKETLLEHTQDIADSMRTAKSNISSLQEIVRKLGLLNPVSFPDFDDEEEI